MTDTLPEIRQFLEQSKLGFEVWDCDDQLADTALFCEHYQVPPENSANTILIRSKSGEAKFALCVLLATHRLDVNHTVRKKLEARKVSFAGAEETRDLTGMEIGGVTPIGLPEDLRVWVDDAVMSRDYIILGGGNRTSKLKVNPDVLLQLENIEVVSGLAR
ncbi:MAG: prolyl-tRNA editing enzyme YbaK/EbsC (Cys-tRNA(Pro) deacylase) [Parasphingorhabdus sp.]|jgi:prolyl-tRNA editing enzyme YbaK/EbsC (Cys-tRNA(Pro) deacylase)